MEKCIIVAVGENNSIGVKGDLPWHISDDLKYFKETTRGFPVIMGRTTFDSIGRPLPGRKNIVLSRSSIQIPGVTVVNSLDEAYTEAKEAEKCFIIGGASIYKATMDDMDKLYVTHVHTIVEDADAFFPEIDSAIWERVNVSPTLKDDPSGLEYEFVVYKRKSNESEQREI